MREVFFRYIHCGLYFLSVFLQKKHLSRLTCYLNYLLLLIWPTKTSDSEGGRVDPVSRLI